MARSKDEVLRDMMLNYPDTMDKRVGSIAYDSISTTAIEFSKYETELDYFNDQKSYLKAEGKWLDQHATNYGIYRKQPTKSKMLGYTYDINNIPIKVLIGSRYSTKNFNPMLVYKLVSYLTTGECILECETSGIFGNDYIGDLLPLTLVPNLARITTTQLYSEANDIETDNELRVRIRNKLQAKGFGGNILDYQERVSEINPNIGRVYVQYAKESGDNIVLSAATVGIMPISQGLAQTIKDIVDPDPYSGMGAGIAPVNHFVTVVSPPTLTLNINITCRKQSPDVNLGYVLNQIMPTITNFINIEKQNWGIINLEPSTDSSLVGNVFNHLKFEPVLLISMLNTLDILNTNGSREIIVDTVTINGNSSVLEILATSWQTYMIPILGEVTLSE